MTVGERIRQRREDLGMTQEDVALLIGRKDKSTVYKIEKSGDKVSLKNVEKIAKALRTTTTYLLGFEDEIVSTDRKIATDYNDILANNKMVCAIVDLCEGKTDKQVESAYMMLKVFFDALEK